VTHRTEVVAATDADVAPPGVFVGRKVQAVGAGGAGDAHGDRFCGEVGGDFGICEREPGVKGEVGAKARRIVRE
jgi:hypothetical protein